MVDKKGVKGKTGNTKQEIPVKIPKETEDPKVGGVNENTIKLRNKIRTSLQIFINRCLNWLC